MKSERLLNAIGKIDDDLIFDAVHDTKKKKKRGWLRWGAAAACLALAVSTGLWWLSKEAPASLPMLTITEITGAGMGFEGYHAYDSAELVSANPWNEAAELSTLPVFKNQLSFQENGIEPAGDMEAMETFLAEVAARLGMEPQNPEIQDGWVVAEENGIRIEVDATMTATISFEPAVSLPEGYHFTPGSSYEDTLAVAEYLKEAYKDVLAMDTPKINVYGGNYDINRRQQYDIEFYNAGGDLTDQILNYHFNRASFYCNDDGDLWMIRIYKPDLSCKAGDYPIISPDEATELLLNGNYITSVPYEIPGRDYIAKVELVYRTGIHEEYYLPYYRFYVELPEMEREDGLKDYGAYYVPAVEAAYLTNMPLWDGTFNR